MATLTGSKRAAGAAPFSREAEDRTDALIQAIDTLRAEQHRADCRHLPALSHTMLYLSERLVESLKAENPHVLRGVYFEAASQVERAALDQVSNREAHDQEPDLWHAQWCQDGPEAIVACSFCPFGLTA